MVDPALVEEEFRVLELVRAQSDKLLGAVKAYMDELGPAAEKLGEAAGRFGVELGNTDLPAESSKLLKSMGSVEKRVGTLQKAYKQQIMQEVYVPLVKLCAEFYGDFSKRKHALDAKIAELIAARKRARSEGPAEEAATKAAEGFRRDFTEKIPALLDQQRGRYTLFLLAQRDFHNNAAVELQSEIEASQLSLQLHLTQ